MKRILGFLAATSLLLSACGGKLQSPDFESVLKDIEIVSPATPATVAIGGNLQLAANGLYTVPPGSDVDATRGSVTGVQWVSDNTAIATVDNTGKVTGLACSTPSPVRIRARVQGFEKAIDVSVGGEVLRVINVAPTSFTVNAGESKEYTATGVYRDCAGNARASTALTQTVNWSITDTTIADLTPNGASVIAKSKRPSTGTKIQARATNEEGKVVVGEATLVVNPALLVDLIISPTTATIGLNATQQFTVKGRYGDGSIVDPVETVAWASSNIVTAKIDANGLATSDANSTPGNVNATTNITASATNADGRPVSSSRPAVLTVKPTKLVSVTTITPITGTLPISIPTGMSRDFFVSGLFDDGSTQRLADKRTDGTNTVLWTVSNARATAGNTVGTNYGRVTGVSIGLVDLTATLTVPGDASGTSKAATLSNITIADPVCVVQFLHQPPSTVKDSKTTVTNSTTSGCLSSVATDCKLQNDPAVVSLSQDDSATIVVAPAAAATLSTLDVDYISATDNIPATTGGRAGFILDYDAAAFDVSKNIRLATRANGATGTLVAPVSTSVLTGTAGGAGKKLLLFPVNSTITGMSLQITVPAVVSVPPTIPPTLPPTTSTTVKVIAACGLAQPP